jgi:outer membrane lipoprotein SlyB
MKKGTVAVTGAICSLLLTGCASHPDPIIDMQGVDEAAMQDDWTDCEAYSEQVVIAKGAAKGAAGGAVAGAAAGAISGHADRGAGYGAVWGATRSTIDGDREKQMVFKRCLRGRGYRVLN